MSIFRTSLLSIRKPSQQQVQSNGSPPRWAIDVACVTALVVYFLHFALPAVAGNLNEDEMPELWRYWYHGPLKWLWANICFWTPAPFYRPGGVFYYWPLYHFFGLAPQPYRIVQIAILAASIPMLYYLSRCLASSRLIAFLATLALCYHPGLISLVFIGSFSYDILCGFLWTERRIPPMRIFIQLGSETYWCSQRSLNTGPLQCIPLGVFLNFSLKNSSGL